MTADAIDRIIEQLARVHPDLPTDGLAVTGRLLRLATLVERRRETLLDEHDLSQADFDVLATLRRHDERGGLYPSQLQRSVMITSGGMTKRLDRLEQAGLIQRAPDPDDRRCVQISLTANGRGVIDRALPAVIGAEQETLARAIPDRGQRQELGSLLREVLRELDPDEGAAPGGTTSETTREASETTSA